MRYIARYVALFRLLWLTSRVKGEFPILKVIDDEGQKFILLPDNEDTRAPGIQSLFWNSRRGHCVVEPAKTAEDGRWFKVLKSFGDDPKPTRGAWLSGWLGEKPEDFGILDYEEVLLENGTLAWQTIKSPNDWVIHVHGRKTLMGETLRNFKIFDDLGFSQLTISHETDTKPFGLGKHKSTVGFTEWTQVERAVQHARAKGAERVVLFGWSLGGMMVGRFLKESVHKDIVIAAIFDSPMFDVRHTLRFQALLANYDQKFADEVCSLMEHSFALKLMGYPKLAVDDFSLGKNSINSHMPMLVLYSTNDGYVDANDVLSFSQMNATAVLVEFPGARHCRLKNSDPSRYETVVKDFISTL
jgi:hypothetical protein